MISGFTLLVFFILVVFIDCTINILKDLVNFEDEEVLNAKKNSAKCGFKHTTAEAYELFITSKSNGDAMIFCGDICTGNVKPTGLEDEALFGWMYKVMVCCSDVPVVGETRLIHMSIMSCDSGNGKRSNFLIPNHYEDGIELHSEIIALCYIWNYFRRNNCVIISQAKPCPWCQRAAATHGANIDTIPTYTIYPMKNSCVWSMTHIMHDSLREFILQLHHDEHLAISKSENKLENDNRKQCMRAFNYAPLKKDCDVSIDANDNKKKFVKKVGYNDLFSHEECIEIDTGDYLGTDRDKYLIKNNEIVLEMLPSGYSKIINDYQIHAIPYIV